MIWLDSLAWSLAVILAIPLMVVTIECLVACIRPQLPLPAADVQINSSPRCIVLVPAHNEAAGLEHTLAALVMELGPNNQILVVADNCHDATAEIARATGAIVVERHDFTRRGKGYAIAFGVNAIRTNPPDVVIIFDADCEVADGALRQLVTMAHTTQRPVQAAYRMTAPAGSGRERRVAEFAFLLKNVVRPLGLHRLGLPCLLTGTGMAFPWHVIRDAQLDHGHIVEDMQLGIELIASGQTPLFAPTAVVTGEFPAGDAAAATQRQRWEHGHLKVLLSSLPRLLFAAVQQRRLAPAAMALEIGVPPLSALLFVTLIGICVLYFGAFMFDTNLWPLIALLSVTGAAFFSLLLAWFRFGLSALPPRELFRMPLYVLHKIPLYLKFVTHPQRQWVRTPRTNE